ncbi:TIR domain-containing protein [Aeromonas veronii]|uniref:TIR domain-containing protein n=1 Tax=Aeromonas veronii TaxID=654 RepID=UPI003BA3B7C0
MKTVFYSWQSDLKSSTNRNIIEKAINAAIKRANDADDSQSEGYILDKDTLNESGSPDIVETIIKKINACSLFIGDITPIAFSDSKKAMPNSNVLFESGYFIGARGFDRAVLVFNEAYAKIESLPFDLKTKRILKYSLSEAELSNPENKKRIINILSSAIHTSLELIKDLPPIEFSTPDSSTQSIKRERDLIKLKRFMDNMPPKAIQAHIDRGFESLAMDFNTFTALYNMQAVQNFIGFKLYDKELELKIENLVSTFDKSLSFGHNFHHVTDNIYRFKSSDSVSNDDYLSSLDNLNNALASFITYVHEQYVEVDIEEYGARAWQSYLNDIREELEE